MNEDGGPSALVPAGRAGVVDVHTLVDASPLPAAYLPGDVVVVAPEFEHLPTRDDAALPRQPREHLCLVREIHANVMCRQCRGYTQLETACGWEPQTGEYLGRLAPEKLTRPLLPRFYWSKMLPSSSMMPIWGTLTFRWPGLPERMILRRATLSSVDDSMSLPFGLPLTSM